MALFYLQFSGLVPGGGLCGGRSETIYKSWILEWDDLPSVWVFHGIYVNFYGFPKRRVVLSVPGLSDCGNSNRTIDRTCHGEIISSAVVGLFGQKISGRRLHLCCHLHCLGNFGNYCNEVLKSFASPSNS